MSYWEAPPSHPSSPPLPIQLSIRDTTAVHFRLSQDVDTYIYVSECVVVYLSVVVYLNVVVYLCVGVFLCECVYVCVYICVQYTYTYM